MDENDIDKLIAAEHYWVVPGDAVMVCALTLKNDYTVIGHAGCVDPTEFDEAIGKELSRKDALSHVWPLVGYEMASRRKWLMEHSAEAIEQDLEGLS